MGVATNVTDNEIKKALIGKINLCKELKAWGTEISLKQLNDILDLINRQQAENDDLFYKLIGVMHSVDKWLDGDELKQDEVNRAATMREKTLRLIESAKDEAIKEFAERLKENAHTIDDDYSPNGELTYIEVQDIDNFLKERVADTE